MDSPSPNEKPKWKQRFDDLQRQEARELVADAGPDGDDRMVDEALASLKEKQAEGSKMLHESRLKAHY